MDKPTTFNEAISQHKDMIPRVMNKLHLYTNHDEFHQLGLIAFWKAYETYDVTTGTPFPAYAYQTIYYSLLDQLKKDVKHQERSAVLSDEILATNEQLQYEDVADFYFDDILNTYGLNQLEKLVLYERFHHNLSFREISEKHPFGFERIRSSYRYGVKKIKKAMEQEQN